MSENRGWRSIICGWDAGAIWSAVVAAFDYRNLWGGKHKHISCACYSVNRFTLGVETFRLGHCSTPRQWLLCGCLP